jgi:spermidine synthase
MPASPVPSWFVEIAPERRCSIGLEIRQTLHRERSVYQEIAVHETSDHGRLLALDGCIMLTESDEFVYHEMLVHPALLSHSEPARVVVVGGGDGGTLREVARHASVRSIVQVEIDERVTAVSRAYFPELVTALDDPRVRLVFADAVAWMREAPSASADVVLVDSTDPVGPAAGLFAVGFLADCRRVLAPGGVLALQSESPILYPELVRLVHRRLAQAGFAGRALLPFSQPTYPSGTWSVSLATVEGAPVRRREDPALATRYYTPEHHDALLVGLPRCYRELLDVRGTGNDEGV